MLIPRGNDEDKQGCLSHERIWTSNDAYAALIRWEPNEISSGKRKSDFTRTSETHSELLSTRCIDKSAAVIYTRSPKVSMAKNAVG